MIHSLFYFLQKEIGLVKVLMRCIGIQIVPLQVSTYATLSSFAYGKSESYITYVLFHVEDKGFGESAYAVHWDPDHAPSSKYLCNLCQFKIVSIVNQLIVYYFL